LSRGGISPEGTSLLAGVDSFSGPSAGLVMRGMLRFSKA